MNFNKRTIVNTTLLAVLGTSLMGGCAIMGANKSIAKANAGIESAESQLNSEKRISNKNFISYSDDIYFGSSAIELPAGKDLPVVFNKQIDGVDRVFANLNEVAATVFKLSGVKVYVQTMGQSGSGGGETIPVTRITQGKGGTLVDLLDNIAAATDTYWTYSDGRIILSQTQTKTFTIKNLPGDMTIQASSASSSGMSGGTTGNAGTASSGSGGGGGGTSATASSSSSNSGLTQNVAFNLGGDFWKKYDEGLSKLLSKIGTYTINGGTSSITVTDKPSTMINVSKYVNEQNILMDKQVEVDINVISVDTTAEDNYGINWNLVLKGAAGSATMAGASNAATIGGSASSIFAPTATTQAFTFTSAEGAMAGSSVIINALSSINKVSEVTSTQAVTMSSQPVPLSFGQQISYLASTQTTVSASGGAGTTQTSLQPGQLNVGFSMNILPVVEANDMIRMQVSVSISNLKSMVSYSSGDPANGGASIQLPTVNSRTFMQKVKVPNRSTFVVTGFDDGIDKITEQGVGQANWWWLGGGYTAIKTKTRLVMMITPTILK